MPDELEVEYIRVIPTNTLRKRRQKTKDKEERVLTKERRWVVKRRNLSGKRNTQRAKNE
jgi:hypothetical protein